MQMVMFNYHEHTSDFNSMLTIQHTTSKIGSNYLFPPSLCKVYLLAIA